MTRDVFEEYHLRRVINASGTLTTYGQSAVVPAAAEAMAAVAGEFFEMDVLFARASDAIARIAHSEAGLATACAAAGLTMAVAGCMTGTDPAKIAQLPDATGMKNEVIIQMGHAVNYGAPVTQGIRLAGAEVKLIGTVNGTSRALFDASIGPNTVAAMYVVSHHTTQYGFVPFAAFVETAHKHGVPVIVDAAAEEHMLPDLIGKGADLVICSGHKHFRAPTSGVMAGRLDLIQAAYAQNRGIGRGMKIGKEGIVGLIVALEEWERGYHRAEQEAEKQRVLRLVERLAPLEGITVTAVYPEPDPYPIMRAKVTVDRAGSGLSAMALSVLLGEGEPSIKTRAHHVEEGYFLLDPFNLSDADADFIAERIEQIVNMPAAEKAAAITRLESLSIADLFSRQGVWPHL
ncbi:MAG: aminotransferase class V-fold PLP-dependent enzyme [Litorilinea sp.]